MSRACTGRARNGFTLVELAISIALIGLLLGGILVPLQARVEQRQVADTQKALENIRDALTGFVVAKGYLPCPDTDTNGSENVGAVTAGVCSTVTSGIACGRLPHVDLSIANSDLWGNRPTYCVNELFARRSPATPFSLSTAGSDVYLCAAAAGPCATTISTSAIFAVVSHGKNGYGAINLSTGAQNPAAPHVDEQENYDNNDRYIVSRTLTATGTTAGEFDDIVIWLPRTVLMNRMVAAGKLP